MQMKSTSKLEKELKYYNSMDQFFEENKSELAVDSLPHLLQTLIAEKGMTRAEVVKGSNLNEVYAYQIISGVRRPSRDKLICLCIAMRATLQEAQALLKKSAFAPLYARNPRDSIIIFAIEHGNTVLELNMLLYEQGEEIL